VAIGRPAREEDVNDDDDEPNEIDRTTEAALAALFTIVDKVRPPESARALLLSIAAVVIAEAMAEEEPGAVAVEVINDTWARQAFPWRMVRLAS
jgi:hypothetical protein